MRDLRDLKKEEGEPAKKKPQPVLMIGLLGLLVFLALFFFFRKGKQEVPAPPPVSAPIAKAPAAKGPAEGGEEAVVKDPSLKPGEMRFEPKKDEVNPPPAPGAVAQNRSSDKTTPTPSVTPSPSPVPPKEDLTFFKTLKEKNGKESKTPLRPKAKKEVQVASVSKPSSNSASLYTIQVASFTEPKGANGLARELKQKGFESYVTTAEVPGKGKRYRVRVGHYATRLDAQKIADRLHQREKLNFLVTSDKK